MDEIVKKAINLRSDNIEFNKYSRDFSKEDMNFELGGEKAWDPYVWKVRGKRPKVTIDTTTPKKFRLANDLRDLNPEIQSVPDCKDWEAQAEAKNGIFKSIQDKSGAESIFDSTYIQMLGGGFSFMHVDTIFEDPKSFNQTPIIEHLPNNLGVFVDHTAQSPCYLDMEWGSYELKMDEKEYRDKFDGKILSSFPSEDRSLDDGIILSKYYELKDTPKKLVMISSGSNIIEGFDDDINIREALNYEIEGQKVWKVLQERDSFERKLHWHLMNGSESLESGERETKFIPIIPCEGRVSWIQGIKYIRSFINPLKEPSRLKWYAKSIEAEQLANATLPDTILSPEAVQGHEDQWNTKNSKRHPYLLANHQDEDGNPIPPPQQIGYNGPANQILQLSRQYDEEITNASGVFDEQMGGPSQLRAGVAIDLKKSQGNQNNFDFSDNFITRTMKYLGVVLDDMVDNYYDIEREVSIKGKGGKSEVLKLNTSDGVNINEARGKCQVKVVVGSATDSKRKEANEQMLEFAKVFPEKAQGAAHIFADNLDNLKDKEKFVEIMKAQLEPELSSVLEDDDPQRAFAENAQLQQQLQQTQAQLQQATQLIESMQIDMQKAVTVQDMKDEAAMEREVVKSEASMNRELLKSDTTLEKQQMQNQGQILSQMADGIQVIMQEVNDLKAKVHGNTLTVEGENNE